MEVVRKFLRNGHYIKHDSLSVKTDCKNQEALGPFSLAIFLLKNFCHSSHKDN